MSNLDLLRKSLKESLNKLASKEVASSNGLLISGWNEQYKYGGVNIFETTFVDMLVHELSQEEKSIIGWEVNYPWNSDGKLWYRSKLDFAIGLIDPENALKDNKPQALFETAIEVKKLPFDSKEEDFSVESEIYIWQDIFKLNGYRYLDSSKNPRLADQVGKEKIMLTFSSVPSDKLEIFQSEMERKFLDMQTIRNKEKTINGWFSQKTKSQLVLEKEFNLNTYDLKFMLLNVLGWTKEKTKYLVEDCNLQLIEKSIVKKIEFVTDNQLNQDQILVASLLYL
ncbi:hypothetical protein EHQ23_19680 [Leptospira bourretii]|uniref:Uncharacterized protein n=1 Tax=Leptospira bourretii TaxID=2484962 RepID=A0A4R9IGN2_9LEPT|nr:hypothetical protein [Leptospira bourretii]TGK78892.1 hypothetical protein EHQ23_19680 [Leptospira bourretii]TGK87569.1 hypothetical protein EHQ26_19915 [Leptospira bourretii]TGL29869.1 hypothetical protein EHQ45_14480 [Leptospira bourretii]